MNTINCTHCQKSITVEMDALGTRVRCPHCRHSVNVPKDMPELVSSSVGSPGFAPSTPVLTSSPAPILTTLPPDQTTPPKVTFVCNRCQKLVIVGTAMLGTKVRCPHCRHIITAPTEAPPQPVPTSVPVHVPDLGRLTPSPPASPAVPAPASTSGAAPAASTTLFSPEPVKSAPAPVTFPCNRCQKLVIVGPAMLGTRVRCPHCRHSTMAPTEAPPPPAPTPLPDPSAPASSPVPAPTSTSIAAPAVSPTPSSEPVKPAPSSVTFPCSNCQKLVIVGPAMLGTRVRCPHCRHSIMAPTEAPPPPDLPAATQAAAPPASPPSAFSAPTVQMKAAPEPPTRTAAPEPPTRTAVLEPRVRVGAPEPTQTVRKKTPCPKPSVPAVEPKVDQPSPVAETPVSPVPPNNATPEPVSTPPAEVPLEMDKAASQPAPAEPPQPTSPELPGPAPKRARDYPVATPYAPPPTEAGKHRRKKKRHKTKSVLPPPDPFVNLVPATSEEVPLKNDSSPNVNLGELFTDEAQDPFSPKTAIRKKSPSSIIRKSAAAEVPQEAETPESAPATNGIKAARKPGSLTWLLLIACVVLAVVSLAIYGFAQLWSQPDVLASNSNPGEPALSIERVTNDYAMDPAEFDKKYKDKVIVVEGIVASPDVVNDGQHWIVLGGGFMKPGDPVARGVDCTFTEAEAAKEETLERGSSVKVKGKCLGHKDTMLNVRLVDCVVLNLKGPPADPLSGSVTAITDEQLAKDFTADAAVADNQYKGRVLEVSGTLLLEAEKDRLTLKGLRTDRTSMQDIVISCQLVPAARKKAVDLSEGQQVKIKGRCQGTAANFVLMSDCQIVEVGPEPALAITAVNLTTAYGRDQAVADGAFKNKLVIVEGVIFEKKQEGSHPVLVLEGFNEATAVPLRVYALFPNSDPKPVAKLVKGQKVKLKGKCIGKTYDGVTLGYVKVVE